MNRTGDQLPAALLDVGTVCDVEPVGRPAARGELACRDPRVDGAVGDPEPLGELADGHLAVTRLTGADPVAPAQPPDGPLVEWEAGAGAHPGLVELLDDLRVGVVGGESLDQLDHL